MQQLILEHLNAFCVLFAQAVELQKRGKMKTSEGQKILNEMVFHHDFFDERAENYINKWKMQLVDIGFYIRLNEPRYQPYKKGSIDISDIEFDDANDTTDEEKHYLFRKDYSHREKKEATIANYCEFSTPLSNLSEEHKRSIIEKTKKNMEFEEYARQNPDRAIKLIQRMSRNTGKWKLSDHERDW